MWELVFHILKISELDALRTRCLDLCSPSCTSTTYHTKQKTKHFSTQTTRPYIHLTHQSATPTIIAGRHGLDKSVRNRLGHRVEWGNAPTRVRRLQPSTSDTTKLSYQPVFFSGRVFSGSASTPTTRAWYALLVCGKHM